MTDLTFLQSFQTDLSQWLTSAAFYYQLITIACCLLLSLVVARLFINSLPLFRQLPKAARLNNLKKGALALRKIVFPLTLLLILRLSIDFADHYFQQSQLINVFFGLAVVYLLYNIIKLTIAKPALQKMALWLILPIAVLQVVGWLDNVIAYLDSISAQLGEFKISIFDILRVFLLGSLLFWLGRISNNVGQQVIRNQEDLELATREVLVKLYQVILYVIVFLVLLQVAGISLTALTVFGGALGVGIGFGLQSIASNFISGMILLLDRTLSVGDYIELEDGKAGTVRELNMRSTTLETYDGKDIMVPNEQFINTTFVNWTHKNHKQRYTIEFQVAYKTDIHQLLDLIKTTIARHPQVISGDDIPIEERPDAEIAEFADSGIQVLVEYWMDGIDDGQNRVDADLKLMIWDCLQQHGIEIPFPQREVTLNHAESSRQ